MTATIEIRAPSEQTDGTRSQVQRWLKSVGDPVAENEPLIELETDKVTIEIPAPAAGVLAEILKQEQDEIAPGELLGRIESGAASQATPKSAPAQEAHAPAIDDVTNAALTAHAAALSGGRNSPAVRRLLSEHKVHAADVRGSGAGGRITVDDVLEHVAKKQQPAAPSAREQPAASPSAGQGRRVPHTSIRKRIAERMVDSLLNTAPHVTTIFELDLSAVLAHRAKHRADFEQRGASLTLTAYFLAACVDAIREVPEANSRWLDDALEVYDNIDIGVGTAVEGKGLVVPVVRAVESLDLFGIARTLADLVARARADKLTPADVRGGTFTISNHGVSGSLVATPIVINQPQSAILGVGKLEKRAVVIDDNGMDRIVVQPRCYVTLTLDHRVMDGHRANRFLQVLVERLENWRD
ncbi:MAG TPA: 2-oxo acid dehydrogenase subunit E2 [Steroidobacteraceae bacterium]|jgi:2-oxoglutarate dehydrogenase E2 component (dihydrolipoamide succinyltransferase)|nr:2-oxo acid dehydrogenase subunit E2 [Steroidobacteraceae bacterium]